MKANSMADRRAANRVQGLLDIGSSKVTAAVAVFERADGNGALTPRILGVGAQRSRGVKAGVLTDLDEAENAVRAAIAQAERASGVTIDGVILSAACGRLGSKCFTANAAIDRGVVADADVDRVLAAGRAYAERDGRVLVHLNRLGFRLDGAPGARDPRGLVARHLAVQLHAVTMDEAPLRNMLLVIDRCHLSCDGVVASPYASGLAATTAEERDLGVVAIDFGAGATSISMFADGRFLCADVIPVGSQHITFDIAKALHTPLAEAERIKTLYGALLSAQSDEYETIAYPLAGESGAEDSATTRARLAEVIRPRMAQIVALVRERLAASEAAPSAAANFVITGGASQMIGAAEFIANELGKPVRLGRPAPISGLTESAATPQLATIIGLALASCRREIDIAGSSSSRASHSYLGSVGTWLRAGF